MSVKTVYLAGMVLFWTVVIVLGVAGLVSYENEKLVRSFQDARIVGASTADAARLNDTSVKAAIEQGATVWTSEIVAAHNSLDNCWLIIDGRIYNVTQYVPFHPGGTQTILDMCGRDATVAFRTKGGAGDDHSASAYKLLASYEVGALGAPLPVGEASTPPVAAPTQTQTPASTKTAPSTAPPTTAPKVTQPTPAKPTSVTLTTELVAQHSTVSDCWLLINSNVYDVTQYIPFHPGGTNTIRPWCGKEASNAFTTRGGKGRHSTSAWNQLERYLIGPLGAATQAASTKSTAGTGATTPSTVTTSSDPYEQAVYDAFPGAQITRMSIEDDGRAECKFVYNGTEYACRIDASHTIVALDEND